MPNVKRFEHHPFLFFVLFHLQYSKLGCISEVNSTSISFRTGKCGLYIYMSKRGTCIYARCMKHGNVYKILQDSLVSVRYTFDYMFILHIIIINGETGEKKLERKERKESLSLLSSFFVPCTYIWADKQNRTERGAAVVFSSSSQRKMNLGTIFHTHQQFNTLKH